MTRAINYKVISTQSILILLFVSNFKTTLVLGKGKGDKQIKISALNYYSDRYANSDKYLLDNFALGLEYEYGLSNNISVLLPVQLSYQNQFIYFAPRIKIFRKKINPVNPSFDIAIVYNNGRQEVCDYLGPNRYRISDIKRNRLGPFLGFSLNPKISKTISFTLQASLGTYLIDESKKYDGPSCGEDFLKEVIPRSMFGRSIAYDITKMKNEK